MIAKKVQKKSLKAYENISCMTKNWPDPRPTNRDYHSKKDKGLVTYPGYQISIFLPSTFFAFANQIRHLALKDISEKLLQIVVQVQL